ncbi:MAG: hypothetical protein EB119_10750 [Synechococcaceae bacterium WBB_34_004]|nr:hypothetical protein [Synechococcaceae bacterium WBB_34_004]
MPAPVQQPNKEIALNLHPSLLMVVGEAAVSLHLLPMLTVGQAQAVAAVTLDQVLVVLRHREMREETDQDQQQVGVVVEQEGQVDHRYLPQAQLAAQEV